jgi:hypothetical protein
MRFSSIFRVPVIQIEHVQVHKGSFERSQRTDYFDYKLGLWPTPQSGQSPKFPKWGMMVLYDSEILC